MMKPSLSTHSATVPRGGTPATEADMLHLNVPFDELPRFVKVVGQRANGLIEFEFSMGWQELSVELMLPAAAFAEFCARQKAVLLD